MSRRVAYSEMDNLFPAVNLTARGKFVDLLQFIVGMTSALAWPLLLGLIVLVFRNSIRARISDISELTWGDKTAKFRQDLDKTISQAAEALPALTTQAPSQGDDALPAAAQQEELDRFKEVVEIAPSLAVVEAWFPIERELQRIAAASGYGGSQGRSVTFILRRLKDDGVLDRSLVKYIENLISLRNTALHSRTLISVEEAQRYREAAQAALARLREL